MLGLRLPSDPRWVHLAQTNLPELLTDHAYCEQKAASNAISLIIKYPELPDLVDTLAQVAQEEMQHFQEVHQRIQERGWTLGRERRDPYVNDLLAFARKDGPRAEVLVDRLLFAAMVEARSCERFKMLSEDAQDPQLREWYRGLMASEANHYTVFLKLARKYGEGIDVDARWHQWLEYEAEIIARYGTRETMHG
jgi:tRNA-(ms[2]io[6]A)-hydroxylase